MAVPKFFEVFLKSLKDGEPHTAKEVRSKVAEDMHLSDADLTELLPSGRQTTFGNRVNWARTYLNKAGLIETPVRGRYRITEEGKKALASGEKIDLKYLERYDAFNSFHSVATEGNQEIIDEAVNESPMEALDAHVYEVKRLDSDFFADEL